MKKLFISMALLLIFAVGTSVAQDRKNDRKNMDPTEKATKVADKMKQNLNLTDSQYKSVYNIFYSHFTDMKSLKDKYGKGSDELKSARKQKREDLKKELSGVLTSDQIQKMEDNRKKHKEKRKGKNKDGKKDKFKQKSSDSD